MSSECGACRGLESTVSRCLEKNDLVLSIEGLKMSKNVVLIPEALFTGENSLMQISCKEMAVPPIKNSDSNSCIPLQPTRDEPGVPSFLTSQ